ncbi:MAG: hypothetical protein MJ157_05990, partial [Clostridia bacterium]|nr:hypothetical protein [Clostridia bacterium]
MLCERCQKKEATVYLTQIINNQKTTLNLCEDCAKDPQVLGLPSFDFHKLLSGFLGQPLAANAENEIAVSEESGLTCPNCGLTESLFSQKGLLGCSQCFEVFQDHLEGVFRKIYGTAKHTGKVPQRTGGVVRLQHELSQLKHKMKVAIAKEAFEQ